MMVSILETVSSVLWCMRRNCLVMVYILGTGSSVFFWFGDGLYLGNREFSFVLPEEYLLGIEDYLGIESFVHFVVPEEDLRLEQEAPCCGA